MLAPEVFSTKAPCCPPRKGKAAQATLAVGKQRIACARSRIGCAAKSGAARRFNLTREGTLSACRFALGVEGRLELV